MGGEVAAAEDTVRGALFFLLGLAASILTSPFLQAGSERHLKLDLVLVCVYVCEQLVRQNAS